MKNNKKIEKWFIWGILFICSVGSLFHFLFDLFNKSPLIGLFSPVNESVWEHFKIFFYPTVLWFIILYFKFDKNNRFVISSAISILISTFTILAVHYIYVGGFGEESVVVDIIAFVLGVSLGQYLALTAYLKLDYKKKYFITSLIYLAVFFILIIYITFDPPHIPLFYDASKNQYGIK